MNEFLNPRIQKLIKDDLRDYAKAFGIFFAIALIIVVVLTILFSMINIESTVAAINIEDIQDVASEITNFLNTTNIFNIINLIGLMVMMFISGIVVGAELPMHVRQGVARNEYFKATLVGAIIVSIALLPLSLIGNAFINLLTGSGMIYNLRTDSLLTMVMYILWFIVFYLIGYLIAMTYQRFGWVIGAITMLTGLAVVGVIGWSSGVIIVLPILPIEEFTELIAPELLGPILVAISAILASGVYVLAKNTPVQVK